MIILAGSFTKEKTNSNNVGANNTLDKSAKTAFKDEKYLQNKAMNNGEKTKTKELDE